MNKQISLVLSIAMATSWFIATAGATSITIQDPSFETPVQGDGTFTVNPSSFPWTIATVSAVAGVQDSNNGKYAGTSPNSPGTLPAPADGLQFAFVELGINTIASGSLSQTLTGPGTAIAAGTPYTLQVAVGQPLDADTSIYDVQLKSGATVLADTGFTTLTGHNGSFANITLNWNSASNPSVVGGNFTIVLAAEALGSGNHNQVNFDNVRLDATVVPEPASWFLGLSGSLGMVVLRGLRRARANRH